MDGLPRELCLKIFHLLDHQSLASAPQGLTPPQNRRIPIWNWKRNFSFSAILNFPWSEFLMSNLRRPHN